MFLIQGVLETAYIGNPFIDKQTGVTTPPKLKLQIMSDQVQKNGSVKKSFQMFLLIHPLLMFSSLSSEKPFVFRLALCRMVAAVLTAGSHQMMRNLRL